MSGVSSRTARTGAGAKPRLGARVGAGAGAGACAAGDEDGEAWANCRFGSGAARAPGGVSAAGPGKNRSQAANHTMCAARVAASQGDVESTQGDAVSSADGTRIDARSKHLALRWWRSNTMAR